MAMVLIIGTLDTKGEELALAKRMLASHGVAALTMDVGIGPPTHGTPEITAEQVAAAAGASLAELRAGRDRGAAMTAMAEGARILTLELYKSGTLSAVFSLGGSGGASVATAAMRALPIGVPKLMVSTVAAGNVAPYVGTSDIMMLYPVIDFAGINVVAERMISNAVAAIAGMASVSAAPITASRPLVAITMFGVTTPAAMAARAVLTDAGYEVLVFHANGAGGRAMEALIRDGLFAGVLDLTTTELADEFVGGVLSAGPDRLTAAGQRGIPQIVSLGALDMVNFGPIETIPDHFRDRLFYRHNPTVSLMRTTAQECAVLGQVLAGKLNAAKGPVAVFVPQQGFSAIAKPGGVFHDPAADAALIAALTEALDPRIAIVRSETDINDSAFAEAMAAKLIELMG